PAQPTVEAPGDAISLADGTAIADTEPAKPEQPEPVDIVTAGQPLPVRPVSPNGATAATQGATDMPTETPAVETPAAVRSGPSTAPLPPLPESVESQANLPTEESWLRDLKREGEEG
ncbi:MAG TPA: hypothetical protein VGE04_04430, partial [Chloroflexia bacterium]